MLASLLFGDYRQKVLARLLLHPEHSHHVREIARLTGTSAGTLHRELARLAQAGVLTREFDDRLKGGDTFLAAMLGGKKLSLIGNEDQSGKPAGNPASGSA